MASLEKKLGNKQAALAKGKKAKPTILDLDVESDEELRDHASDGVKHILEEKEYYTLEDIEKLTEDRLVSDYKASEGLAAFVVKKAHDEIKRLKKGKKRARE